MLSSSFALAPAPVGVALVDMTPALTRALNRLAIFPTGAAEPEADAELVGGFTREERSRASVLGWLKD